MTSTQIKEILKGNFTDESDKTYWENKLAEIERKEKNAEDNKKYYSENIVYNR